MRLLVKRELTAKRELPAQTHIDGTKNQITDFLFFCFSFEGSEHDGTLSIPRAPGGAEVYFVGWLASNTHLLGCAGDNHPHISLEGLRFGPSRSCSVTLSRGILSSKGMIAYVVLNYVSRVIYSCP